MRILVEHPTYEYEKYGREVYEREEYDRKAYEARRIGGAGSTGKNLTTIKAADTKDNKLEIVQRPATSSVPVKINGASPSGGLASARLPRAVAEQEPPPSKQERLRFDDLQKTGKAPRQKTTKKIWHSQTGQLWIVLLFLVIVLAVLISFWLNEQHQEIVAQETIRVLIPSGVVQTMALEDYLIGVVAAEMPVNFETEALKAQGVASRTFAARHIVMAQANDAAFDVDTTTATQVWWSDEQMRERWGDDYEGNKGKIVEAVQQTRGQVLMFDHNLATTAFFSNTGRLPTESSDDVWGGSLSYLSSVSSPESEGSEGYVRQKSMGVKEFLRALNISSVSSLTAADIKVLERTTAGRIARISVAGHEIKGTDFRKALDLASTDVEWEIRSGKICLTTYGYGHGVGLSQYGAQNMALQGQGYKVILAHYYQGTELNQLRI